MKSFKIQTLLVFLMQSLAVTASSTKRPAHLATASEFFRTLHAQLLELAVKMGAFQSGALGDPGHAAAFALKMMLEVGALEGVAGFAQRQVEGNGEAFFLGRRGSARRRRRGRRGRGADRRIGRAQARRSSQ